MAESRPSDSCLGTLLDSSVRYYSTPATAAQAQGMTRRGDTGGATEQLPARWDIRRECDDDLWPGRRRRRQQPQRGAPRDAAIGRGEDDIGRCGQMRHGEIRPEHHGRVVLDDVLLAHLHVCQQVQRPVSCERRKMQNGGHNH